MPKLGKDDHISDKTNKCSYESKCANCAEGHMAGNNDCDIEKGRKSKLKKYKLIAEWEDEELFKS